MAKAKTVVGLDVHAAKIVAAVLDAETGQLNWFQISGDAVEAAGFCAGLPRPLPPVRTPENVPPPFAVTGTRVRIVTGMVLVAPPSVDSTIDCAASPDWAGLAAV